LRRKLLLSLFLHTALVSCTLTGPENLLSNTPDSLDVVGWQQLAPGLEWRVYPYGDGASTEISVVRIDPANYAFRVHYTPEIVRSRAEWAERLTGVVAFVNTSFYDENNVPLGLVVSDGVASGISYQDRGGTFFVQNGLPGLRSNINDPIGNTPVEQAVQAFPMLVINGEQAYTQDSPSARRSAIGIDQQGRVLLMVTSLGGTTLNGLSDFLAQSDMNLVNAMNFDGGGSSLMTVNIGDFSYRFAGIDPVPVVLAVYPR
jgi:uncharacterized protein YigE (DUF2233 family)